MKQLRHKRSAFHAIPGSQGLPVIGETIAWRRDPLKFLQRHYSRYGRIFRSNIYDHPEITMLGPQANEFILSSHRDYFEWAGGYDLFPQQEPLSGQSVLTRRRGPRPTPADYPARLPW
jgi:hypothetical protein